MIEHKISDKKKHHIIIRPNPAMPWKLIKKIYIIFASFILIIAIILSMINLYLAIPFYGIEVIFLGYALYITALKSSFYEEVIIDELNIKVSFVNRKNIKEYEFVKQWAEFKYKPSTKLQPSEISISKKGKKYLIAERVNELDRKKLFNILKTL